MKLTSCSKCGKVVSTRNTTVIEHKRVCDDCKSAQKKELETWTISTMKR